MSLFTSRRASAAAPDARIEFGGNVPDNASMAELLGYVEEGSVPRAAAVAHLRSTAPTAVEVTGRTLIPAQARVLEEYLKLKQGRAATLVCNNVSFSENAFQLLCNGVAQSPRLQLVTFTRCQLTDADTSQLGDALDASRAPVAHVDLSYNKLGQPVELLERLKRNTKLETLNLSGNRVLCVDTLAGALEGHWPALTEVILLRTGIAGDDAKRLNEAADAGSRRFSDYSTGARSVSIS
jgi:hypothetical protein